MKTYQGQRPADAAIGDCRVYVIEGGHSRPLYHVKLHSDALEWSYAGSGPADTALSILADHFGERPSREQLRKGRCKCWCYHQMFKFAFIAPADPSGFTITSEQVAAWLKKEGGDDDDENT